MDETGRQVPVDTAAFRRTRPTSKAQVISRAFAFFGTAASMMVLAGWQFDVPVMRSILPGQPPMVALTAIGCILLGASLLLTTRQPRSKVARGVGKAVNRRPKGTQDRRPKRTHL